MGILSGYGADVTQKGVLWCAYKQVNKNRTIYIQKKSTKQSEEKNELEGDTPIRNICAGDNARSSV